MALTAMKGHSDPKRWIADRKRTYRIMVNAAPAYDDSISQIEIIQNMFSNALQSDLEHGVKCLNENASREFHEKYPELTAALNYLSDLT